eukprot:581881-Pleurochrysis_carterae.AAC.1
MARIRTLAASSSIVGRLLSAAFTAMEAATRNHAAEFLPGGVCSAESITDEDRERLSSMPITATTRVRASSLGTTTAWRLGCASAPTAMSGSCCARRRGTALR